MSGETRECISSSYALRAKGGFDERSLDDRMDRRNQPFLRGQSGGNGARKSASSEIAAAQLAETPKNPATSRRS